MIPVCESGLAIFVSFMLSLAAAISGCALKSPAASNLTEAEIESMAKRAAPALGIPGAEPELPRVFINTNYVPPTGKTIAVAADGDFQAALNPAQPGEIIALQAGATYKGNSTLPVKKGNDWIVIRTSAPDSSLPPPGTRITPAYASALPKIVTPNSNAALEALSGAHHFRLI